MSRFSWGGGVQGVVTPPPPMVRVTVYIVLIDMLTHADALIYI